MDGLYAEDKQSNLEANNEFLTKENEEEHNSEDAGDAEVKGKNRCCCLQEQQSKEGKVVAAEGPLRWRTRNQWQKVETR